MKKLLFVLLVVAMGTFALSAEVPLRASSAEPTTVYLPSVLNVGFTTPFSANLVVEGASPSHTDIVPTADGRTFLVGKTGLITLLSAEGSLLETPFLDIRDRVLADQFERGLFTIALHPNYETNRAFYVAYVRDGEQDDESYLVISQFTHPAATPDQADPDSEKVILEIERKSNIHHGGALAFGPDDGYLYVTVGDDSRHMDVVDGTNFRGKILRIDVDPTTGTYTVPPDNPFVDDNEILDEIYATGLRNPWRLTFDPVTHDAIIADVGEANWEEINLLPAGDPGGQNFGWPCFEGPDRLLAEACQPGVVYTPPTYAYAHEEGRCSITGGVVYTGEAFPRWQGNYLFGDLCTGELFMLHHSAETGYDAARQGRIPSFFLSAIGSDASGELLVGGFNTADILAIEP